MILKMRDKDNNFLRIFFGFRKIIIFAMIKHLMTLYGASQLYID